MLRADAEILEKNKDEEAQRKAVQSISPNYKPLEKKYKVAVIGAGWFGVHTALELSKTGYAVSVYEKNKTIFNGTSGNFGVRIHAGPHYPRSYSTRKTCRDGFYEIQTKYPEVCNQHLHAIYAHGKIDANGNPSKVTETAFNYVCKQFEYRGEFNLEQSPFSTTELSSAHDINEPSGIVGVRLRTFFEDKLRSENITVHYRVSITQIKKQEKELLISHKGGEEKFDAVIDATGFQQNFLQFKQPLPFNMNVFYQPCLALVYKDRFPGEQPISLIIMDGWFPCLMPYDDRTETEAKKHPVDKYIMTHGKWTIVGSYKQPQEAWQAFSNINDQFIQDNVKGSCETEMKRFWPTFLDRFEYVGWKGSVLAKMKTEKEFRGSVVFQEPTVGMISIFPGKITNIFDSALEVQTLVTEQLFGETQNVITSENSYRYVKGGVLDTAGVEIAAPVVTDDRNTCSLQTYTNKLAKLSETKPLAETRNGEKEKKNTSSTELDKAAEKPSAQTAEPVKSTAAIATQANQSLSKKEKERELKQPAVTRKCANYIKNAISLFGLLISGEFYSQVRAKVKEGDHITLLGYIAIVLVVGVYLAKEKSVISGLLSFGVFRKTQSDKSEKTAEDSPMLVRRTSTTSKVVAAKPF